MAISEAPAPSDIRKGIGFILLAMLCVSMNDVMVKALSGTYPLHELMFVRSGVALAFTLVVVHLEGGMRILRTDRPFLHAARLGFARPSDGRRLSAWSGLPADLAASLETTSVQVPAGRLPDGVGAEVAP